MATYQYRCPEHGLLEVSRPIGTAPAHLPCAVCRGEAGRVINAPMLSLAPKALVSAMDRAARSADEPEVVTSLPSTAAPRQATPAARSNPAWQRLPRP